MDASKLPKHWPLLSQILVKQGAMGCGVVVVVVIVVGGISQKEPIKNNRFLYYKYKIELF